MCGCVGVCVCVCVWLCVGVLVFACVDCDETKACHTYQKLLTKALHALSEPTRV